MPYTVGLEEEVMLLDPTDWSLAHRVDDILPVLSPELASQATAETHGAAIELATSPHRTADGAAREAGQLRAALEDELADLGLRAASLGTHPRAVWTETQVSGGARYQLVYGSMRELARREPTFALHVHIGVTDAQAAITLYNRLRAHLPLLLALSVNSPFWQGRDTGIASMRTPLFQAFPRVGIPRAFGSYDEYATTVDLLMRCEAFPEPTFLWWDVRPQPKFGTVELRIMDAQTTAIETGVLAALVQAIAHLELEEGFHSEKLISSPEVLQENRFLAARDGMNARLIDPVAERRVPARELLESVVQAALPHAVELGCEQPVDATRAIAHETGAARQLRIAGRDSELSPLLSYLADVFV
jgi:glutamate---cysteine ligase / carboxylate-amine ligase